MEFPVHPINENCRRPSAALDRNLSYLGLVEILYSYFIDAVVLTTGSDKTTPAAIPEFPESQTPWQEIYRASVNQFDGGGVFEAALKYRGIASKTPRHNH